MKNSNEVEILAILEALWLYVRSILVPLIIESDSCILISWASGMLRVLRKLQFYLNEIRALSSSLEKVFDVSLIANEMADALAKQGASIMDLNVSLFSVVFLLLAFGFLFCGCWV